MSFVATWIDPEIIILSEVSQKEKDKYHIASLTCDITYITNEHIYEAETDSQTLEQTYGCWGRSGAEGEGSIGGLGLANASYYIQNG